MVIMDAQMPDLKGVEAVRQMICDLPGARLLALSMHANRQFAGEVIKAGACGYLLKDHAFEELVHAIQAVADNRIYLCQGLEDSIKIKIYPRIYNRARRMPPAPSPDKEVMPATTHLFRFLNAKRTRPTTDQLEQRQMK